MKNPALGFAVVALAIIAFGQTAVVSAQKTKQTGGDSAPVLKVGDKAPDFEAGTFDDKTIKLSDRFGDEGHAVVLLFSRANW